MKRNKQKSLERMLDVAFELFTQCDFDDVSIRQIAHRSGCSTQTIYDAYGSKEHLFQTLFLPLVRSVGLPSRWLDCRERKIGLNGLLPFTEIRLRYNLTASCTGLIRTLCARLEVISPAGKALMQQTVKENRALLRADILRCIEEGLIRPVDPAAVIYILEAGAFYEGFMTANGFMTAMSCRAPIIGSSAEDTLRKIFAVLVTEAGERELEAYFSAPPALPEDYPAQVLTAHRLGHRPHPELGLAAELSFS